MTYHEDVAAVKDSFKKMLADGVYKADLFADLALMPKVLKLIQEQPMSVVELYDELLLELDDVTDFMSVMDCLYALRALDINDEGEVYICLSK